MLTMYNTMLCIKTEAQLEAFFQWRLA